MKQAVERYTKHAPTGGAHQPRTSIASAFDGPLAQLTSDIQASPRVQSLKALAHEVNQPASTAFIQRQGIEKPQALQGKFKPIPSQPQSVAQLQVFKKLNGKFYSDLDPSLEFDTYQEAMDFEAEMEPPPPITGGRSATLFTYTSTKSTNKLSTRGIPQGPHTVGYSALTNALFNSKGKIDLEAMINEQVRTPEEWRIAVNEVFGKDMFDGKSEQSKRVLRAYRDYNGLYQELQRVRAGQSTEDPYDLVHEMIQLDPYAVYKANNPTSVKKKHLKNKGETGDLSNPKNIDTNAKFKNKRKFDEMVENRMLLLDEDFVDDEPPSGSDSSEYDSSEHDSDNDNMSEEPEPKELEMLYEIQEEQLLWQNNCLINAICLALGRGTATEAELLAIRFNLNNVGEMMLATPHVVGIIRNVLGINNQIVVHYPLAMARVLPNEVIPGILPILNIYHTNGNHFQHICPNPLHYQA